MKTKRSAFVCALLASAVQLFSASNISAGQVDIPGPAGSEFFGQNFGSLTTTTANGSGVIQFEDSTSSGLTKGFYRLTYP